MDLVTNNQAIIHYDEENNSICTHIAIAMAGTMSSCVDSGKDLYDPSYETPNPMGDGFAAPDDIDWNMITTKKCFSRSER